MGTIWYHFVDDEIETGKSNHVPKLIQLLRVQSELKNDGDDDNNNNNKIPKSKTGGPIEDPLFVPTAHMAFKFTAK